MKIFVVIPNFNEKERFYSVLKDLEEYGFPVIVVDDGSIRFDHKKLIVRKNVVVLRHKINLGKGAALKTGCDYAFSKGADAVILMDADGQHKVEDLPKFIEVLESRKYDLIFGSRNLNMGVPLVRYLGNKFASVLIASLFGIYVSDILCGYKALTKKAYNIIEWESPGYGVETEITALTGKNKLKFCEVPVTTVYYDKVKGVTFLDAIGVFIDVILWRIKK